MTDSSDTDSAAVPDPTSAANQSLPVAKTQPDSPRLAILHSRMWLVTLVCLIGSVVVAWQSLPDEGPSITIDFPEGHGLRVGDPVRHRGIDVGIVEGVALSDDLRQVRVRVTLTAGSHALTREGTRYWIVRPQVSLAGITGLETAVGAKYIAVSPGPAEGAAIHIFRGLSGPPPDPDAEEGLSVVLRCDDRSGLSARAPVTYRGVDVGRVTSVQLSPGAKYVLAELRIDSPYDRLVRQDSLFWTTSGFNVDVGLSGVELNADSLSTILRGGVAFGTPPSDTPVAVQSGHVFSLSERPDDEWLADEAVISLIDVAIPRTVTIQYTVRSSILGIGRTKQRTQQGVVLRQGGGDEVQILTAGIPELSEGNFDQDSLQILGAEGQFTALQAQTVRQANANGILTITPGVSPGEADLDSSRTEIVERPEECLLVRSAGSGSESVSLTQTLVPNQLSPAEGRWTISDIDDDLASWNGCPVLSLRSGKLIGILNWTDDGPNIVLLSADAEGVQ